MKENCILHFELIDTELLSAEEVGMLTIAMIEYTQTGKEPELTDRALIMSWKAIKRRLDDDFEKYAAKCNKNKENATKKLPKTEKERPQAIGSDRKRSVANASERKRPQAIGSEKERSVAMAADNDNDNDIDIDYNPPIVPPCGDGSLQEAAFNEASDRFQFSGDLKKAARDWILYKRKSFDRSSDQQNAVLLKNISDHAKEHGEGSVIGEIYNAISNGYKGIVWSNIGKKPKGSKFNNTQGRDYNMDELELKLLASN